MSGRMKGLDLAVRHILQALLQSEQVEAGEVVFGPSCRKRDGEFSMFAHRGGYSMCMGMPDGLSGARVREVLMAVTGLDQSSQFPRQSDLVLEIPKSEFILEFAIDEKYETHDATTWQRMRWLASLATPESPIVLRRMT
jgi:hypothetical protein